MQWGRNQRSALVTNFLSNTFSSFSLQLQIAANGSNLWSFSCFAHWDDCGQDVRGPGALRCCHRVSVNHAVPYSAGMKYSWHLNVCEATVFVFCFVINVLHFSAHVIYRPCFFYFLSYNLLFNTPVQNLSVSSTLVTYCTFKRVVNLV